MGGCLGQLVGPRLCLWLAEIFLPPVVREQLVALPVKPGEVFYTSTRAVLAGGRQARIICVVRFSKSGHRPSGDCDLVLAAYFGEVLQIDCSFAAVVDYNGVVLGTVARYPVVMTGVLALWLPVGPQTLGVEWLPVVL